ncbi:unnamed protein product [Effrenium voratum]|nr:unnamed protein product [Effrenium voratum]
MAHGSAKSYKSARQRLSRQTARFKDGPHRLRRIRPARPQPNVMQRTATRGEKAAELAKKGKDLPPPSRSITMDDVDLQFSRSSGPGGQNVNKVETRVQASFDVDSARFLPQWVKDNLRKQEANRFNKKGILVVSAEDAANKA